MNRWETLANLANQSYLGVFGSTVFYRPALRNHPELADALFTVVGIFTEKNIHITLMGAGTNGLDT
ncbi:MAG: hypothetical protein HQL80_06615, partial [Magnetococcales bacterium]|nr:hypothetical protein [Magnetococcales bacterium]